MPRLASLTNSGLTGSRLRFGSIVPTYTLTPAVNNINEGSSLTFTVGGSNITNGTYYWTINNTTTVTADFGTNSGSFTVTSNSGSFTVTPTADVTTEGSETFTVSMRSTSISGTVLATSSSVTVNDTSLTAPTYTLTPAANNVNEGSSLTFTVGGTNIINGTYYWTVTNSGDFGTSSGSFTITSNSGTFAVTPTADTTTEGSETFTASIRSGSVGGTVLQTSSSVTINDTSLTPVIEVDPNAVWVAATKGFPTTGIDVFAVTSGQLASSSSSLYSSLEANSYGFEFTVSPQNNFVYAPNGTKNRIEIIPVNPNTGIYIGSGATSTSTSALGTFPGNITISPDGNYAYVTFLNSFKIAIYSRNATTGALTGISNLRDGYSYTKITSDGAYLYSVLNNLLMYSRNISTGALTLIAENSDATVNGGFSKIAISSDNRSLYVADFAQNYFYSYLIDPATGLASLSQTISLSSFGADVRSQEVEVSNDGKHVYVTLYDINQVLGTTVVMYSRSLTSPFTLTQANVYTISGAVGEQISNLILTKQQDLLIAAVSGNPGAPIHSWSRNTTTGTLTLNSDVVGFGGSIETNR
jgi:hypothetical protein